MEGSTSLASKEKTKTKAKQRYLKRKKERRKHKKEQVKHGEGTTKGIANEDEEEEERSDSNDDLGDEGGVMEVDEDSTDLLTFSKESKHEKRLKKRRKHSVPPEEYVGESIHNDKEEGAEQDEAEYGAHVEASAPSRSPSPVAALPSFPLPSLPDAPTESALALQGLDQALMEAEVIDPSVVLPISQQEDTRTGLSEKMQNRLQELGITELFAVQTALLPFLLPSDPWQKSLYQPYNPPRDVCVSAPTGSGKTLAYAVPIVEILSSRIVTRLRALVVLPTRDLVTQVRETFEAINKGRGLKIGTATGQNSFVREQSQLIADKTSSLLGGSSKVDILICTPGRLIDHLTGTPNFSLQHLRFLIIDEADRLLAQSYQGWLTQILAATRPPKPSAHHRIEDLVKDASSLWQKASESTSCSRHDALNPAFLHLLPYPDIPSFLPERKESSCQKLLFSATLTRDPAKLASLELREPKYFVVHRRPDKGDVLDNSVLDVVTERFTFPETLKEHMVVCETAKKPLILFHLVHRYNISNALIFTKSAESTARLVHLFDFFEQSRPSTGGTNDKPRISVRAYSSDLGASERKSILANFKDQEIQILICSDLISRGIDISHVTHIISYDAPIDMRKYVHRVGRTARAGKGGDAWTLVEEQEARYFKTMLKNASHLENVKRERVREQDLAPFVPHYETALTQLKDVYTRG